MIKFGDRKRVVEKYEEWFADANEKNNGTLANNNMTFMAFLTTTNLLNTDAIKKFLED